MIIKTIYFKRISIPHHHHHVIAVSVSMSNNNNRICRADCNERDGEPLQAHETATRNILFKCLMLMHMCVRTSKIKCAHILNGCTLLAVYQQIFIVEQNSKNVWKCAPYLFMLFIIDF